MRTKLPSCFRKLAFRQSFFLNAPRKFSIGFRNLQPATSISAYRQRKLSYRLSILLSGLSVLTSRLTTDSPPISHAFAHTLRFCSAQCNHTKSAKRVQAHARVRHSSDSDFSSPLTGQGRPLKSMASANSGLAKCGVT